MDSTIKPGMQVMLYNKVGRKGVPQEFVCTVLAVSAPLRDGSVMCSIHCPGMGDYMVLRNHLYPMP